MKALAQKAFYSLFLVEKVIRGLGILVKDLRTEESHFVVDQGLGISGQTNLVLATRLLPYPDFTMTGGAALPLGVLPKQEREGLVKLAKLAMPVDRAGQTDSATLIRSAMARGASNRVRYQDVGSPMHQGSSTARKPPDDPPLRNSKCPCGSGKKYKLCCMKNR